MKKVGVAILGVGTVGGGVYEILTNKKEFFKEKYGLDVTVESVLGRNRDRLVAKGIPESLIAESVSEIASNPSIDVVVETIGGVGAAKEYVEKVLASGKTVVTANKELFAKYRIELENLARKQNAGLLFEATCVGGVPVIRVLQESMQGNRITSVKGIINGTTNYILTKMSQNGWSYAEALKQAEKSGFAEADPSADVEGFDAAYKLAILSSLAFGKDVYPDEVYREGITSLEVADIGYAKSLGYVVKLLAVAKDCNNGTELRVHPALIKNTDMLSFVNDGCNAIKLCGDAVGELTLIGQGAGALPTASAVVSDVIFASLHRNCLVENQSPSCARNKLKQVADFTSRYYVRFSACGKSDCVSRIVDVFKKSRVSVEEVKKLDDAVLILAAECSETRLKKCLESFDEEEGVAVKSVIRVDG